LTDAIKVEYFDVIKPVNLGNDTLLCPGSSIILNAFDAAATSFRWQDGSAQATFEVESPGIYAVTLTDHCNNIETDSIEVQYYQLLTNIDIGPRDTVLCVGETLILDASSEAQGTYFWQDGTTTPTYAVSSPGIYQIQVNDYCGNSASDEIRIRYTDVPKPDFLNGDTIVCEGEVFRLNATAPDATFYRWQDGLLQAIYPVTDPGFYSVTVGNACGSVIYSLHVEMEYCGPCRTFTPTAFSPNGDGNNDQFQIGTECVFTHYEMRIFNRWGMQVFTTIAPWTNWDGTQNGKELPTGVYVWQLRYKAEDGSEKTMSGDVLLMR
jgi:gliding motility-associated-like protein